MKKTSFNSTFSKSHLRSVRLSWISWWSIAPLDSCGSVWVKRGIMRKRWQVMRRKQFSFELVYMHHILSLSIYASLSISQAQALVWQGPYPSRLHERLTLCQLRPGVTESHGVSRDSRRVVGRQIKCYNRGNRLALEHMFKYHVYSIYEVIGESKNACKNHFISDFVHSKALVVQRPVAAR